MNELISKIKETLTVIRNKTKDEYPIGIILGTGLGGLVKDIKVQTRASQFIMFQPEKPVKTV